MEASNTISNFESPDGTANGSNSTENRKSMSAHVQMDEAR